jgi:hypothetical protein
LSFFSVGRVSIGFPSIVDSHCGVVTSADAVDGGGV